MMSNHQNLTDAQLEHIEKTFTELIFIDEKSNVK